MTAEELARFMHDKYEEVAREKGWATQEKCRVSFDQLPQANRETMIAVADAVLRHLVHHLPEVLTTKVNATLLFDLANSQREEQKLQGKLLEAFDLLEVLEREPIADSNG